MMTCIEVSVLPSQRGWFVQQDRDRLGPYGNEYAALKVAVSEAAKLRDEGVPVRASVKDRVGNTTAEYCLCKQFKFAII